ncbi:Probable Co/Zn/Cd efflux system membrane fusion protein [hydrothermal vent metagenome]|uniref:Probable Co/Zn/Cd efflux system membrane fusion protein n=1 Tax=hydrothermal vent metagenome TaxID=652676 RepID=A0A3B1B7S9_9ZZZZ
MNKLLNRFLILCLLGSAPIFANEEHEEEGGIPPMTLEQRHAMGILTQAVASQRMADEVIAPSEVMVNRYHTTEVTPRITAQIIRRHARMGEQIKKGQKLVTLSSVEMAEAQGQLLIADKEWQRVQKLGRKVVSEKRYVAAQVDHQQAYAKVLAFGMTGAQVKLLLKQGDVSKATGTFDLISAQAGTVLSDDFVIGRVVEPGQVLMEISDESRLWVEAKLAAEVADRIEVGMSARVSSDEQQWVSGKVIQIHRRMDETTRTLAVRIELDSSEGGLRPGQFVKSAIALTAGKSVMAVPSEAVVLLQGDYVVFKPEGDEIHPAPVERGVIRGNWTEIKAGLALGDEIVIQGAYVLKSLLLKSMIGDAD